MCHLWWLGMPFKIDTMISLLFHFIIRSVVLWYWKEVCTATCLAATGCVWLQLDAFDCNWMRLTATGCVWLQLDAYVCIYVGIYIVQVCMITSFDCFDSCGHAYIHVCMYEQAHVRMCTCVCHWISSSIQPSIKTEHAHQFFKKMLSERTMFVCACARASVWEPSNNYVYVRACVRACVCVCVCVCMSQLTTTMMNSWRVFVCVHIYIYMCLLYIIYIYIYIYIYIIP